MKCFFVVVFVLNTVTTWILCFCLFFFPLTSPWFSRNNDKFLYVSHHTVTVWHMIYIKILLYPLVWVCKYWWEFRCRDLKLTEHWYWRAHRSLHFPGSYGWWKLQMQGSRDSNNWLQKLLRTTWKTTEGRVDVENRNLENRKCKAAEKLGENNLTLDGGKHKLAAIREIHGVPQTSTLLWTADSLWLEAASSWLQSFAMSLFKVLEAHCKGDDAAVIKHLAGLYEEQEG